MSVSQIVARCEALYEDLSFRTVKDWKAAAPGRKAIGYMPVYVPREVVYAAGMLPVAIYGGGDQIEVIQGDAYYQSYICRIPRSTIELGVTGRLDVLDGVLFPSICDVIRNLSGMWKIMFKDKYVRYVDVPHNFEDQVGGDFLVHELGELRDDLAQLAGRPVTDDDLRHAIAVYNENRKAMRDLYAYRAQKPWQAPTYEVYLLSRAGTILPPEEHTRLVREYIAAADAEKRPKRDNARVVVNGAFCEQPPLGLIKSIEMSGCYIVDDDWHLITRWQQSDVAVEGDPLVNLSTAFLHDSAAHASLYTSTREEKGRFLVESVKRTGAEGVVFAMASFCDPALLDRPMLQDVLARHGIPYTAFKYAENTGQMAPIREQAGTFADSIKLWSAA